MAGHSWQKHGLLGVLITGAFGVALTALNVHERRTMVLATGTGPSGMAPQGGQYYKNGSVLQKTLLPDVPIRVVPSPNNRESIRKLQSGEAQLAFLSDGMDRSAGVQAVAILDQTPLYILYDRNKFKDLSSISDIPKCKFVPKVYVGSDDSAASTWISKILHLYGCDSLYTNRRDRDKSQTAAFEELKNHRLDVAFMFSYPYTKDLEELIGRDGFGILPLERQQAVTDLISCLGAATIHAGTFGGPVPYPQKDIPTVYADDVLACSSKLTDREVYDLVQSIDSHRLDLQSIFPGFAQVNWSSPAGDFNYPLNAGAEYFYLHQTLPTPVLWSVVGAAVGLFTFVGTNLIQWLRRRHAAPILRRLAALSRHLADARTFEGRNQIMNQMRAVLEEAESSYREGRMAVGEFVAVLSYYGQLIQSGAIPYAAPSGPAKAVVGSD